MSEVTVEEVSEEVELSGTVVDEEVSEEVGLSGTVVDGVEEEDVDESSGRSYARLM